MAADIIIEAEWRWIAVLLEDAIEDMKTDASFAFTPAKREKALDEAGTLLKKIEQRIDGGEAPMSISFVGESYEIFQNQLDSMREYGATVTTQAGEIFEAVLVGADRDAEMGDTVLSYEVTDGDFKTIREYEAMPGIEPRSDRVLDVEIS